MTHVLSRQQLYDLVWAEPKTKVARKLSVSDVALGKACVKLQVPMPARGYWAKLAAGKKLEPTPLPRRGLGKSDEIRIGGNRYGYYDRSEELEKELPPEPVFDGDEADVRARATASLTTKFLPKTLAAAP